MISVEEFQAKTEQMHAANVARIKQLAQDAQLKADEALNENQRLYWLGMRDGLQRTLRVLDGHG